MTLKRTKLIWWMSLIIFILILVSLLFWPHQLYLIDNYIRLIVNNHRLPLLTTFWTGITHLFDFQWILVWILVTTILGWRLVNRQLAIQTFVTLMTGLILNRVVKDFIQRPRPDSNVLLHYAGYSFPSGHSSAGALVCGMLVIIGWHYFHKRWVQWLWTIGWATIIILIGCSRVYVGAHYPSDVLAGWMFGLWIVATLNWFWQKWLD